MAAKKPGAPATVTLKHLAASLAESHEMSKKQTEAVLGDLVGLVSKHLKKGDRIRIGGLGILVVQARRARRTQSRDRRDHSHQGQQESGLPCRQGAQGSGDVALSLRRTPIKSRLRIPPAIAVRVMASGCLRESAGNMRAHTEPTADR
jgi:nucleoid DNA-binding protein